MPADSGKTEVVGGTRLGWIHAGVPASFDNCELGAFDDRTLYPAGPEWNMEDGSLAAGHAMTVDEPVPQARRIGFVPMAKMKTWLGLLDHAAKILRVFDLAQCRRLKKWPRRCILSH